MTFLVEGGGSESQGRLPKSGRISKAMGLSRPALGSEFVSDFPSPCDKPTLRNPIDAVVHLCVCVFVCLFVCLCGTWFLLETGKSCGNATLVAMGLSPQALTPTHSPLNPHLTHATVLTASLTHATVLSASPGAYTGPNCITNPPQSVRLGLGVYAGESHYLCWSWHVTLSTLVYVVVQAYHTHY